MALGGCTSSDVIPILKKKRVPLAGYEVHLTGNVLRDDACHLLETEIVHQRRILPFGVTQEGALRNFGSIESIDPCIDI
jgi:uncharacterized OsmC-like protein